MYLFPFPGTGPHIFRVMCQPPPSGAFLAQEASMGVQVGGASATLLYTLLGHWA